MSCEATSHLVAFGDSHLEALKLAADLHLLKIKSSIFSIVPGATVVGLRNPNSLTDAVNIFKNTILNQPRDSHLILHLGEVDCGFVIWWRAEKLGESIEKQFICSINSYNQFLNEILEIGFHRLCVVGASLPIIKDGIVFGEVANKRSEIIVGIRQRTDLTLKYNDELRLIAQRLGISYFDITGGVLDRTTHLVHDYFRNQNPGDHHLDKIKTVGIWAEKSNLFIEGRL